MNQSHWKSECLSPDWISCFHFWSSLTSKFNPFATTILIKSFVYEHELCIIVHVHNCYANFCNKVVTHDARKLVAILSRYGSTWEIPVKAFQVYNCLSLSYCSSGRSSQKRGECAPGKFPWRHSRSTIACLCHTAPVADLAEKRGMCPDEMK